MLASFINRVLKQYRITTCGVISILLVFLVLVSCNTVANDPSETQAISTAIIATSTTQTAHRSQGMQEVNGTRLFYKMIGAGDPIIFLHGSGGSHRYFLPFMEAFADSNQLLFYDQRGTGLSDGQVDMSAITIDQFVEDLEALRESFGFDKVSLVGHSWGAIIALSYADKYQANLDHLILVDPIPVNNQYLVDLGKTLQQRVQSFDPEDQQMYTKCTRSSGKLNAEERSQCNQLNAKLRFRDPEKASTIDTTLDENTEKNADLIQSLIRSDFNRSRPDIDLALKNVNVPTLILHGDFDPIPIASSEYIQQTVPGSQIVIITDSGHFPFVEQPEQFYSAVRSFMK